MVSEPEAPAITSFGDHHPTIMLGAQLGSTNFETVMREENDGIRPDEVTDLTVRGEGVGGQPKTRHSLEPWRKSA